MGNNTTGTLAKAVRGAQAQLAAIAVIVAFVCVAIAVLLSNGNLTSTLRSLLVVLLIAVPLGGLFLSLRAIKLLHHKLTVELDEAAFSYTIIPPEQQRLQLNSQVMWIEAAMQPANVGRDELLAAYIAAEDLALRQLEADEQMPLMRHISLNGMPFDAVAIVGDCITCVDVTFLVEPDIQPAQINALFDKFERVAEGIAAANAKATLKLQLALVTQLTAHDKNKLRQKVKEKIAPLMKNGSFLLSSFDITVHFYDFEELQLTFTRE